jgi:hypothetical protein
MLDPQIDLKRGGWMPSAPNGFQVRLRRMLGLVVLITALFGNLRGGISAEIPAHPYVGYEFSETRKTKTDHRRISTEIFLTGDDYVGFRYREDILGSLLPVVKAVRFENEYRRKATAEEQATLCRELVQAGVFELTTEPWNEKSSFSSRLDVRINKREARYSFNSAISSGNRRAIHRVMIGFAKRMHIDQPLAPTKAITITEGDSQPARDTALAELIADPARFHGKRVSVVGYYHWEFEGSSLSLNEEASRVADYARSIWRGEFSTFARNSVIHDKTEGWMRVDGVFLQGPAGHLGLWPGEIVRLTRIESLRSAPHLETR